jgi:hypothetical protein
LFSESGRFFPQNLKRFHTLNSFCGDNFLKEKKWPTPRVTTPKMVPNPASHSDFLKRFPASKSSCHQIRQDRGFEARRGKEGARHPLFRKPHQVSQSEGTDFMNLHFGRKLEGQILSSNFG